MLFTTPLGKGGQSPPLHPSLLPRLRQPPGLSAPAPRRGFGTLDPPYMSSPDDHAA